ncbi:MAG: 3'(2'),5'-bisphosphate nucleotidase CysQ [Coxiellaceae bacterium]|nr:3'(2'),5'-bisphosphate nucleotidase CysQ [Coxiellaceae bacterium]
MVESIIAVNSSLLNQVKDIAKAAGKKILEIYGQGDFEQKQKLDGTPLTAADQAAHVFITARLSQLTPDTPILSEESKQTIEYEVRKNWSQYWLVDPLDGTKEFIKRNGEFTVNIALIEDGKSVLGVVYAPVLEALYFADVDQGAYRQINNQQPKALPIKKGGAAVIKVVASKSHCTPETKAFIKEIEKQGKPVEIVSKGSSLKLCMVAEGSADIYPRLAPTMEWDTAAAQCVVEQAGKQVLQYETSQPVTYNKKDLLNPWFVVK